MDEARPAVVSQGPDLEVLLNPSDIAATEDSARSPRPRRWILVGTVLTALVLGWLAFPVRAALARSVVKRLEGHWLDAEALDRGRFGVTAQLTDAGAPGDEDRVRAGTASLYREEISRLRSIGKDLRAALVADPPLSRLRAAMIHATAARSADLDRVAKWYSAKPTPFGLPPPDRSLATIAAVDRADVLLDSELHQLGLSPRRVAEPARYRSADPILGALNRIADHATGTQLIVSSRAGPLFVDIDANRIIPARLTGTDGNLGGVAVIARHGYAVLGGGFNNQSNNQLYWAVSPDLQGTARPLGAAIAAAPAVDPSGVWLQRVDGTVVEVGGEGNVLSGPFTLPAGMSLRAATNAGLVLTFLDNQSVSVWDPSKRMTVRTVTTQPGLMAVVAAGHDTIVWVQGTNLPEVHVTSASTGEDRTVTSPSNAQPCSGSWSISPDGSKVASTWCVNSPTSDFAYAPGIIDVASGRLDLGPVTPSAPMPTSISWSNGGDRIFIADDNPALPQIFTYRLGSTTIDHLRLRHLEVLACDVVAP